MYFWKHKSDLPKEIGTNLDWRYILTLVFLAVLFIAVLKLYKHLNSKRRRHLLLIIAVLMPLLEISRIIWLIDTGQFEIEQSLPLQLCRIMLFLQSAAILRDNKHLKTFCYAAGMPGAVLAFILPDLSAYPVFSFEYLRYSLSHFLLALVPLLWVLGDRFRPHADIRVLLFSVLSASLGMLGINSLLGSNYFYVSRLPGHVNINITQPWYFIAFVSFMMAVVTLMMVPFMHRKSESGSTDQPINQL